MNQKGKKERAMPPQVSPSPDIFEVLLPPVARFNAVEHFHCAPFNPVVPILSISPCAMQIINGRVETNVPSGVVLLMPVPPPSTGIHFNDLFSGMERIWLAHFQEILRWKGDQGNQASLALAVRESDQVLWTFRDPRGWVITCRPQDGLYEWYPGDQFACYEE
jgi:hypothetical protein